MAWLVLFVAGLCEVGWAVGLKLSKGFTIPAPSVVVVVFMAISIYLLAQSLKALPLGTAYAVWTGIGAVGTALVGIWLFREPAAPLRLFCIALIVVGITGLRFAE